MNGLHLFVLAGGFGTRLRPAVLELPKPLAPVNGKPFLGYLLEDWIRQGTSRFTFLLHHRAEMIQAYLNEERTNGLLRGFGCDVVLETEPLGTGGAIAHGLRYVRPIADFLVANADTWVENGVATLSGATAAAVAIVEMRDACRYGVVRVEGGHVTAFEEKGCVQERAWINGGLYRLHASLFDEWTGNAFSLEAEFFPTLAAAGRLKAVSLAGNFIDIGIPEDYRRFCRWIESGKSGAP